MKIWIDEKLKKFEIHPLDNWKKLVEKEIILPKIKKSKNSRHALEKVLFSIIEKKK